MPHLTINGESKETSALSIAELLTELSLPAQLMLVEYNGKALHRSEWEEVRLFDRDALELMTISAGG